MSFFVMGSTRIYIMLFTIFVICAGGCIFSLAAILANLLGEKISLSKRYLAFIFAACLYGLIAALGNSSNIAAAKQQASNAEWASKGCPVYKSSCGSSKHPYACERRGVVVGRNQVGDIFVDAYPICKAK